MIEFPEILFETDGVRGKRVCLACGTHKAVKCLYGNNEVVPMCPDCCSTWNVIGYDLLQKVKPNHLIKKILWFKVTHPFHVSWYRIYKDLQNYKKWGEKMKRFMKGRKGNV